MTKHNYSRRGPIGSTDVYSRKHLDRQFDRLERLYDLQKQRNRDLADRVTALEKRLSFTIPEYQDP